MDFSYSDKSLLLQHQLIDFYEANIIPRWAEWQTAIKREDNSRPGFVSELRAKVKAQGLWNLALPDLQSDEPGTRLSNLEYAPLAE
tara:strand:+ start:618 stop:875 length:258 start_codon:yes stop_codon:yes gene_type:complete